MTSSRVPSKPSQPEILVCVAVSPAQVAAYTHKCSRGGLLMRLPAQGAESVQLQRVSNTRPRNRRFGGIDGVPAPDPRHVEVNETQGFC